MNSFRKYLTELDNISFGQAIIAHEPTEDASISVSNPKVRSAINHRLSTELNHMILAPEEGVQKIRKVLHYFSLDLPALYDADSDGDELIFTVEQFGSTANSEQFYLYLIYYLKDEGNYDFYAEIIDEQGVQEILDENESDEDEEETDKE